MSHHVPHDPQPALAPHVPGEVRQTQHADVICRQHVVVIAHDAALPLRQVGPRHTSIGDNEDRALHLGGGGGGDGGAGGGGGSCDC